MNPQPRGFWRFPSLFARQARSTATAATDVIHRCSHLDVLRPSVRCSSMPDLHEHWTSHAGTAGAAAVLRLASKSLEHLPGGSAFSQLEASRKISRAQLPAPVETVPFVCHSACNFGSDSNLMQSLIRVALPLGESAPCNKHFAAPVWCRVGLLSKVRSTTRIGPFSPSARLADLVFVHRAGRFPDAFIAIIGAA